MVVSWKASLGGEVTLHKEVLELQNGQFTSMFDINNV